MHLCCLVSLLTLVCGLVFCLLKSFIRDQLTGTEVNIVSSEALCLLLLGSWIWLVIAWLVYLYNQDDCTCKRSSGWLLFRKCPHPSLGYTCKCVCKTEVDTSLLLECTLLYTELNKISHLKLELTNSTSQPTCSGVCGGECPVFLSNNIYASTRGWLYVGAGGSEFWQMLYSLNLSPQFPPSFLSAHCQREDKQQV